jgi:hypothetical protein
MSRLILMYPIPFIEANCIYAKTQRKYLPLPAYRQEDGTVTTCWKMGFLERLEVLLSGRVWLSVSTFNQPLQPLRMMIRSRFRSL